MPTGVDNNCWEKIGKKKTIKLQSYILWISYRKNIIHCIVIRV